MRKLASLILFGTLLAVLSGCSMHGGAMQDGMVKCPACGHEFNVPSDA